MLGTHCSAVLLSYVVSSKTSSSVQRALSPACWDVLILALPTKVLMSWHAYRRRFLQAQDGACVCKCAWRRLWQGACAEHILIDAAPGAAGRRQLQAPHMTAFAPLQVQLPLDLHTSGCLPWLGAEGHLDFGQEMWVAIIAAGLKLLRNRGG